jgi:hypothetical protein
MSDLAGSRPEAQSAQVHRLLTSSPAEFVHAEAEQDGSDVVVTLSRTYGRPDVLQPFMRFRVAPDGAVTSDAAQGLWEAPAAVMPPADVPWRVRARAALELLWHRVARRARRPQAPDPTDRHFYIADFSLCRGDADLPFPTELFDGARWVWWPHERANRITEDRAREYAARKYPGVDVDLHAALDRERSFELEGNGFDRPGPGFARRIAQRIRAIGRRSASRARPAPPP